MYFRFLFSQEHCAYIYIIFIAGLEYGRIFGDIHDVVMMLTLLLPGKFFCNLNMFDICWNIPIRCISSQKLQVLPWFTMETKSEWQDTWMNLVGKIPKILTQNVIVTTQMTAIPKNPEIPRGPQCKYVIPSCAISNILNSICFASMKYLFSLYF